MNEVPFDRLDLRDNPETLSAPIIVRAYACGTARYRGLPRAAAAHGEYEKRTGEHDAGWPDWYAE